MTAFFPLWLVALSAEGQPAVPTPERVAAMEAERARRAAVPDTPGTGAFPAIKEEAASLADHVVYRPADLGQLGSRKLGLYLFGNGGCSNDGASSRLHLLEIASHGYLAIALGRIRTGPGATVPPEPARPPQPAADGAPRTLPPPATDSKDLITALDWALAQNADPASPYHGRIDPTAVAVSGYSCGGLQALQVAADPRIKTLVIMNSGLFNEGSPIRGMNVPKTLLDTIHTPTLYVLGGETDIAYENGMDDFARIDHVPVVVGNVIVAGHGGTYWEPNGGKAAAAVVAWLDWQLRGDEHAAEMFEGKSCGLCVDAAWKIDKKRVDLGSLSMAVAADADVAGVWNGTMDTQIGPVETTITVDAGAALVGKVKVAEYEGKIEKGRLEGNRISFEINIERGTITYEGTVSGDEMKLNVVGTTGNKMTLLARRQE